MKLLKLLFLVFFPAILSAQESCRIWDGTDFLGVNADGSLNVTANAGTNLNTSALATESTLSSIDDNTIYVDTDNVKPNALIKGSSGATSVDDSAVKVVDGTTASTVAVIVTNCGDEAIYLYWTSSVTSTLFFRKLAAGEAWEYPLGTHATASDVYAIRASAQDNDDVCTSYMMEQ